MKHFIDFAWGSLNKLGEELCGDRVLAYKDNNEVIIVLSDGLGSGVKANILSTLTSKIAITMLKEGLDISEVVETLAFTLPICKERELAYSTFSIIKINSNGMAYIAEYDSPELFIIRNGKIQELSKKIRSINNKNIKEASFQLEEDDILIFISDGALYAGEGMHMNLKWGWSEIGEYLVRLPFKRLAPKEIVNKFLDTCDCLYLSKIGDDTTVVAIKITSNKEVAIFSGPPKNNRSDSLMVNNFMGNKGMKIVCGGTASNIVSREIEEEIFMSPSNNFKIPPYGRMKSIPLVTEGVLTLRECVILLNKINTSLDLSFLYEDNGASKLARILYEECTKLKLYVGMAINPAHQNPNFPDELSIKYKLVLDLKMAVENIGRDVEIELY